MKKLLTAACLSLALPTAASADFVGVYAGVNGWQSDFSGTFNSGNSDIDVQDELGLDDATNSSFYLAIEHPVPVLPNIRIQRTELSIDGSKALADPITFDGKTFDGNVDSDIDLSHTDATLYYELLDGLGWVSLDLGATIRLFDGAIELTSADQSAKQALESPLPMLYGKVLFHLPFTGVDLGVEGNYIGYDGTVLSDLSAKISYESPFLLGVEAGYRRLNLELDDIDDINSDMEISGPYIGATFHF